jgi:hypothetical protein
LLRGRRKPWRPRCSSPTSLLGLLDALDATGQTERAQLIRWDAFEERLSVRRLRAYLKALPDFEDIAAEERAVTHALGFKSFSSALYFLVEWPDLANAAQLVLERRAEIDGNAYHLLDPAARLLEGKHPLAATSSPGYD